MPAIRVTTALESCARPRPVWRRRFSAIGLALAAAGALLSASGCTSGMGAAVQSLRELLPRSARADATKLDPRFEYLRVTRGKHTGLMYRGSVERNPAGQVDVYYSGPGEVLRLQDGRIVGALGLTTEWRRVEVSAPAWAEVARAPAAARVVRTRDVMPGYISGLREELTLRLIEPPARSAVRAIDPRSLMWFEERITATTAPAASALPPARYAVDPAAGDRAVVYAEQCLAPDLCFTWQRWSEAMQHASTR